MTLPDGFQVRLANDVRTSPGAGALLGGAPLTSMRLSRRANDLLDHGVVTVADSDSAHLAERLLATGLGHPVSEFLPSVAASELTVVIPVHDRPEQLDRALAGLQGLACLVVDDGSQDPAAIEEVSHRREATCLRLDLNAGPAGARNHGLACVSTPYVAFVDSDVQVTADALLRLARHFADPALAMVGPRITGSSSASRPRWYERYEQESSSLTHGFASANVRPGSAVAWLPSACLVARVPALGRGFDHTMRVAEDVDLVWRLVRAGHRVRYDPAVSALHDTRTMLRSWLGRKAYYGTGAALLGQRHGDAVAPAVLAPTSALAAAALLTRNPAAVPLCLVALISGVRSVRSRLPDTPDRTVTAIRLSTRGVGWAVRQEARLLLREWWPLTALLAVRSAVIRKALVAALLVDSTAMVSEASRRGERPHPSAMLARRLDDLAYGTGVWLGAVRAHSASALLPTVRPTSTWTARSSRRSATTT